MTAATRRGLGCMRLSTERGRDDERAVSVLHAAFDAGVTFLDTADAYCLDASETGHNERLIARALATWNGDRSRIVVATKGGLTRPQGHWIPDGRARHLVEACEASRRALGIERIALYQLHAVDPRTPLATSVRGLDSLRRDGLIEAIGLCNVTVGQIEDARSITHVASVQVELSPWRDDNLLNGVAEYCAANDILLIAHRPLGGVNARQRILADKVLASVAARHRASPFEIALAWLEDLSRVVVTIPGATRIDTVLSSARAHRIRLSPDDRAALDERFPAGVRLRQPHRLPPDGSHGDVVLIMGLPGAGKSTVATTLAARGYERLNRDDAGGTLAALLPALDRRLSQGASRIVLDNTYVSRKARAPVIDAARRRGLAVRCLWLNTSLEDSQVNAVWRIVSRHGRLLDPEELRSARKQDVTAFGPAVQFRYQRELEPPHPSEGFSRVDVLPFTRESETAFDGKALMVWCDGILRRSRAGSRTPSSPDDEELLIERGEVLRRFHRDGWHVLGLSWQPGVADATLTAAQVEAGFARMRERLGAPIVVEYCPHAAGPPVCWCRKPLPGLGVVFIRRYRLDPSKCIYVGAGPQDPGFARRLGFQYREADEFFAGV
jgi:aryl-alcohol dehydrogenase-like predicted oxidoreductase/histidinol phosphatase-like enzyme/predicted kinase